MAYASLVAAGHRLVLLFALGGLESLSGCGRAPEVPVVAAPVPVTAGSHWSKFHSKRFQLTLGFPSGRTWSVDDHSSANLAAKSDALRARVRAVAFYEPKNQNRAMCTERAKALGYIRGAEPPFVEQTEVHPSDYDGEWTVAVRRDGDALFGTIMWVGAKYKRCIAIEYVAERTTREERELAEHLGEVRGGLERWLVLDPERVH